MDDEASPVLVVGYKELAELSEHYHVFANPQQVNRGLQGELVVTAADGSRHHFRPDAEAVWCRGLWIERLDGA